MEPDDFTFTSEPVGEVDADGEFDMPTPEEAAKPKREQRTGVHTLKKGDHPALVAQRLYGRQSRGRDLVLANPDVIWVEGAEIKVPD